MWTGPEAFSCRIRAMTAKKCTCKKYDARAKLLFCYLDILTQAPITACVALKADFNNHDIDICIVSETHVKPDMPNSMVNISDHVLFRGNSTVNMVKRVCSDCPIANCGAKYLVKLSNHLTDVHQLDYSQRRKWLQEAKLQPKVRVVIYRTKTNQRSETSPSKPQEGNDPIV